MNRASTARPAASKASGRPARTDDPDVHRGIDVAVVAGLTPRAEPEVFTSPGLTASGDGREASPDGLAWCSRACVWPVAATQLED